MHVNFLDLFSGIGGFALAAQRAEYTFRHHYHSEIEQFAQEIYAKHFPESISVGDISKFDASKLPEGQWLLCGGFPCQDLSTAGQGRGLNAERSGLWWEMHRVIGELRPQVIFIENVPALATNGLTRVVSSLADIGYDAEWDAIPASAYGAPHQRKRLWVVAYAGETARQLRLQTAKNRRDMGEGWLSATSLDRNPAWSDWQARTTRRAIQSESSIRRVDDGVSVELDSARLAALGNAIVPQVATGILRNCKPLFACNRMTTVDESVPPTLTA